MPPLALRTRVLLISSALVVGLTAATLAFVSVQANGFVNRRLAEDLRRSQELIASVQRDRLARLQLAAQVVGSFPHLLALAETNDSATLHDFLLDYQQRNAFAQLLIVLDPTGRVIARTDAIAPTPIPDVTRRWLQPALAGRTATGLLTTDSGEVYQAAVTPAEAGGTIFGFLLAGAPVEQTFAQALRDVSRTEIILLGETRVLGTTLRQDQLPWRTLAAWRKAFGGSSGPHVVAIAGERYAALATHVAAGEPLTIVSLQSRDQAIAPYRRIQYGLVWLGILAAALGVGASALVARNITAPVATLAQATREVAAGNFDFQVDIRRRDELGELASSFNRMTQGLRERADMQKFVSQSTVEMIQARQSKPTSAGERRVMTMFFSDVRGFTALSEHRSPEEVVRVLNRCLSLQADLVRRFAGDIDKYIGDAVFAHFHGPDMVLNAIRCAIEIHRAMEGLNASIPDDPPLALGVGIVSGEAILGSIGSEDRLDYTAVGSNVNLSSRLCGMAGPREILMNEGAYVQVRDLVAAEPLPPLDVKGFSEPVKAWRMLIGT